MHCAFNELLADATELLTPGTPTNPPTGATMTTTTTAMSAPHQATRSEGTMDAHNRKTYEAITEGRAPRALPWSQFVSFWQEVADDVAHETGDLLAVHLYGHRVVFRRQHDGRVSLDDIERARRLLASTPPDWDRARIITYVHGDGPTTERQSRTISPSGCASITA